MIMMWILNAILTGFLLYLYFKFSLIVIYEIFVIIHNRRVRKEKKK